MNSIKVLVHSFDNILPNSVSQNSEQYDKNVEQINELERAEDETAEAEDAEDSEEEQNSQLKKNSGSFVSKQTALEEEGLNEESCKVLEKDRQHLKEQLTAEKIEENENSLQTTGYHKNNLGEEEKKETKEAEEQDDDEEDDEEEENAITNSEEINLIGLETRLNDATLVDQPESAYSVLLSILYTMWTIIYFLPKYLIVKPITLAFKIILYPFVLIKASLGFGDKQLIESPQFPFNEKESTYDSNNQEDEEEEADDPLVTREKPSSSSSSSSSSTSSSSSFSSSSPTPLSPSRQRRGELENLLEQDEYQHDDDDVEDKKLRQLKKDSIMANEVKSPTSFSKYLIPPPIRLYPLSRNPHKKNKKKILILDLDETLIHSLSRGSPRSFHSSGSHCKMIEIRINNMSSLYYVHKRPYCDYFLREISKWFELQIFTASVKEYADPIINWLEEEISDSLNKQKNLQQSGGGHGGGSLKSSRQKIFTKRYYRNNCSYRPGVGYIKDLSKYIRDDELKNVMILDNSPISYALHEDNAISIEGWINDQNDRDLLNLLPLLHSLSLCIDVRFILGLKNGEKLFES